MASGYKQVIVGRYFEQLAQQVFGGELCRNENGDLCLWRHGTAVEIKGSGYQSQYGYRLDLPQIDRCKARVPFPFSRAWYALFAYDNPRLPGTRSSKMAPHVTPESVSSYLSDSLSWCVVVDLSIVHAWKEVFPKSYTSILGHLGTPSIDILCPALSRYTGADLSSILQSLRLNPREYAILSGGVKVTAQWEHVIGRVLSFPMTAILPKADVRSFQRLMRRRGFQFSSRSVLR